MLDVTSSFVFDVTALSPLGAAVTWSAADVTVSLDGTAEVAAEDDVTVSLDGTAEVIAEDDVTVSLDGTAEAAAEDDVTVSLDGTAEAAADDDVTFVSPDSLFSGGADSEAVCVVFPDDVIEDSSVIVKFSRLQLLFNYGAKQNPRYKVDARTLQRTSAYGNRVIRDE